MPRDRVLSRTDYERLKRLIEDNSHDVSVDDGILRIVKTYLTKLKPVETHKIRSDVVTLNSRFCLKDIGNGKKEVYSLVFPEESNSSPNNISVLSPLGLQVLGCRAGNVVRGNPHEEQYYQIEKVIHQPLNAESVIH